VLNLGGITLRGLNSAELTERQRKILEAVIHCYTFTAEPVGSRTVAKRYNLGISPATVRNVMADLEEMGYLFQPHTSAGRVPTEKGYRLYVDELMRESGLTREEKELIEREYEKVKHQLDRIMEHTSKILSLISRYVGVAVTPPMHEGVFRHIELISVGANTVLSVIITASGMVRNKLISLDFEIPRQELERIADIINERLSGISMSRIRDLANDPMELRSMLGLEGERFRVVRYALDFDPDVQVYLDGRANMLSQPEFSSVKRMERIFRVLEERDRVWRILYPAGRAGEVQVKIGSEVKCRGMEECSVVSAVYRAGDMVGTIGIIGPKRMEYPRVIPLVRYTARMVSQVLGR